MVGIFDDGSFYLLNVFSWSKYVFVFPISESDSEVFNDSVIAGAMSMALCCILLKS